MTGISERDWQRQVTDLAALLGWKVYHPWLSIRSERGFPDLTLVRPPRLVFAELKRDGARPTAAQSEWLDRLGRCTGVESYLWRPSDLDAIVLVLQ